MSDKAVSPSAVSLNSEPQAKSRSGKAPAAKALPGDRRAQILDATACLFADYGYEATSMRQIANEVNILAGSLYHHFATKEEMLHAILRERLDQMVNGTLAIAQLPVDAEHRLVAGVIFRLRQYVEHWQFHAILLQETRFFRRHGDFAYVVEAKAQVFEMQKKVLEEGMAAGLFHADIDTYMMIGTISRMLSSGAAWFRSDDIHGVDNRPQYSFDGITDFYLDCVLRMVRTPSRLPKPIPRAACEQLLKVD